jgi:hypothetical protein
MPKKIPLSGDTYATKRDGKLVMVREKRNTALDIGFDLLGEVFGGPTVSRLRRSSPASSTENSSSPNPFVTPQDTPPMPPPDFPLNASEPSQEQQAQQPAQQQAQLDIMPYPAPGIYQSGDRQLALLPVGSQGQPILPQQGCGPYYPPWVYSQGPSIGPWSRFNFPPIGVDPSQFAPPATTSPSDGTQTSVSIQHHICANCKRLRSRKYQSEHALRPGEVPAAAFCRRCQKDATSTDRSEDAEADSRKYKKRKKPKDKSRKKGKVSLTHQFLRS